MKFKPLYALMLSMGALFASCDPSTVDGPSEWSTIAAEDLQVTATPIVLEGGKNSNRIAIENKSQINTQWVAPQLIEDDVISSTSAGETYVTQLGEQNITVRALNGGEMVERTLTVQVDTISYITDAIKNRLCISDDASDNTVPHYFGVYFDLKDIKFEQEKNADGTPGNSIKITSNPNPVLCTFRWGSAVMNTNVGTITTYDLIPEAEPLTVEILTASGMTKTYTLGEFSAEAYTTFPEAIQLLTGWHPVTAPTATKSWKFSDDSRQWGNGNYGDKAASWWTTTIESQGGSTGTMTFDFANKTLTTTIDDPTKDKGDAAGVGAFELDFSSASGNIICTLRTSGEANVPYPMLINESNVVTHTFQVVTLNDAELWLCAQHTDPSNTEGTFWHFVPVEE